MDIDLDISKLHKKHSEREKQARLAFETVYQKCREKILYTNNSLYKTECNFTVPKLVFGLPLFNIKACICYIKIKLKKQMFEVKYIPENTLYITWHKQPDSEDSEDSSIEDYYSKYYHKHFGNSIPTPDNCHGERTFGITKHSMRDLACPGPDPKYEEKTIEIPSNKKSYSRTKTTNGNSLTITRPSSNNKTGSALEQLHYVVNKLNNGTYNR